MGAWIEIELEVLHMANMEVAPYMGAWIEICQRPYIIREYKSLPTWERGLKCICRRCYYHIGTVAPYMGAWIEISRSLSLRNSE